MDQQKQDIADRLKQANNILVTVSTNPSVDQLASCIALAVMLNKMDKHCTAVFSGDIPNAIEFLQPEKTLEKNTDSLRDFIIALDKAKADKLRYKVEDKIVKIFITPYKTSLSDKDLEFSQGDFNVDVVVALGVHEQADLDQAITAHGRILHDATVITLNTKPGGELGSLNWVNPQASSLSELVLDLVTVLNKELLDGQIATALLTGIVAETDRFSNEKTSPTTMTMSAELMAAGANQQLVVTKLKAAETPPPPPLPPAPAPVPEPAPAPAEAPEEKKPEEPSAPDAKPDDQSQPVKMRNEAPQEPKKEDGTLEISHIDGDKPLLEGVDTPNNAPDEKPKEPMTPQINIDDQGSLHNLALEEKEEGTLPPPVASTNTDPTGHMQSQHMVLQPPSMGGQLTANTVPEDDQPNRDPLSLPAPAGGDMPLLQRSPFAPPASATMAGSPSPFGPLDSPEDLPSGSPAPSPSGVSLPPLQPQVPPSSSLPPLTPPSAMAPGERPMLPPQPPVQLTPPPPPAPLPPLAPLPPEPAAPLSGAGHLANARDAVMQAMGSQGSAQQEPIQALNAQPFGNPLHQPPQLIQPDHPAAGLPPLAPPPVPPPMMPPSQP